MMFCKGGRAKLSDKTSMELPCASTRVRPEHLLQISSAWRFVRKGNDCKSTNALILLQGLIWLPQRSGKRALWSAARCRGSRDHRLRMDINFHFENAGNCLARPELEGESAERCLLDSGIEGGTMAFVRNLSIRVPWHDRGWDGHV
jgi:hypothetical protein